MVTFLIALATAYLISNIWILFIHNIMFGYTSDSETRLLLVAGLVIFVLNYFYD